MSAKKKRFTYTPAQKAASIERRSMLKDLSETVKMLMDCGEIDALTVNEALEAYYIKNTPNTIFKDFKGWKDAGYTVKKGSKAFAVWGKPRMIEKKDADNAPVDKNDLKESGDKKKFKYYAIANIFGDTQVELTQVRRAA